MLINKEFCSNCGMCISRCPVSAIKRADDGNVTIDWDECVECNICLISGVCKKNAIYQQELKWPRIARHWMSCAQAVYMGSEGPGRGTHEGKTNDVTGRYGEGVIGIGMEFGRPNVGAYIFDIEKAAQALAKLGYVVFEPRNPVTMMMENPKTGTFKEELLRERILSGILEFVIPTEKLEETVVCIKGISQDIHSVFSLDVFGKVLQDGTIPQVAVCEKMGIPIRPNSKNNVGLGRPFVG